MTRLGVERRLVLLATIAGALFGAHTASTAQGAEAFPNRPVKMVVPFPAGGPSDMTARIVAIRMAKELNQAVIVENRPSAAGAVGTEQIARGPADGYSVLVATTSVFVGAPIVNPDAVRYDPINDFASIGIVSQGVAAIYAHSSLGVDTPEGLVNLARKQKVSYASSGVGTLGHLSVALFEQHFKLQMVHIPYKGTGQLISDLIAGHVQMGLMDVAAAAEHVKRGTLKPVFIAGLNRRDDMPGIPSMSDLGMNRVDFTGWNGFFVPARTPPAIRARLSAAVQASMADPDVQRQIRERNMVPMFLGEAEAAARIRREIAAWNVSLRPFLAAAQNSAK